jgi:ribonuclease HI
VSFTWVKGHSGDPMNDFVDALATAAADVQSGRSAG